MDAQRQPPIKIMGATLLGTAIEWYDYGIYIFAAAVVFPKVFFPTFDDATGVLVSYITLAIAGITRPLGAVLFGHIGDRLGRRRALIISLVTMTIATTSIGMLPGFATAGWISVILLFTARIVQSLAVGGEWGGATLYAVEAAPPGLRALYGSFPQIGNGLGLLGSTGMFTLITMPRWDHLLVEWTWRIPFLIAGVLGIFGIWLRIRLEESPIFQAAVAEEASEEDQKLPIVELMRTDWRTVLKATGAFLITIAGLYVISAYVNARGTTVLSFNEHDVSQSGMMVSITIIVVVPLAAWAADVWSTRLVTLVGLIMHMVVAFPMLYFVEFDTIWGLWLGQFLGTVASSIAYAVIGTYVSGWFQARTRQSGISLAYQLAGLFSMAVPAFSQYLDTASGHHWQPVAGLFFVMAAISTLCVFIHSKADLIDADIAAREKQKATDKAKAAAKAAAAKAKATAGAAAHKAKAVASKAKPKAKDGDNSSALS
ncbi:MAG: MFS transporter [Actinomycetaceae bacterium]|nr:MFS transporter [Actinomycetaceae bacterium]